MTAQEGIKKVRSDFFAFHVGLNTGYKIIADTFEEHEKCGLKEIAYFDANEPYLTIQKKSIYKEITKIG